MKAAFDKFCATYAPPENIFSDNGKEFSLLEYSRDTTPANYPQANGKIERLHKEIGKLCRIHKIPPNEAIIYLQTPLKRVIFLSDLKMNFTTQGHAIFLSNRQNSRCMISSSEKYRQGKGRNTRKPILVPIRF